MRDLMKNAKRNEEKVVKIQSWARGQKVRKEVSQKLAQLERDQQPYYYAQGQYGQPPQGYYGNQDMQYQQQMQMQMDGNTAGMPGMIGSTYLRSNGPGGTD